MRTIKNLGDGALSILACPYSGPFAGGKDSDGETFTRRTNFCFDWPPASRPLLYDHGLDPDVGLEPIGTVDLSPASIKVDAAGVWVSAQLSKSSRYWLAIRALLAQAEPVLYASSGAYGHLTKRDRTTGEILIWPLVEVSLTPTPSNFYARVTPEQAKAWKAAGLPVPQPGAGGGAAIAVPSPELQRLRSEGMLAIMNARQSLERHSTRRT